LNLTNEQETDKQETIVGIERCKYTSAPARRQIYVDPSICFGHYDFGHYDFGHYDFGHYDFGHYDFGHYDFGHEVSSTAISSRFLTFVNPAAIIALKEYLYSYPERRRDRPCEASATRLQESNDALLGARVPNPADKFWKMREGIERSCSVSPALPQEIQRKMTLSSHR
jgi:hypothetical protein